MHFAKPALTVSQHITQLKDRGLIINDESAAELFLKNVSYYRLAGYWWPLQSDKINHIFKAGSRFETVVEIYNFDRALRLLLFDAIERIEIGFRTRLIYEMSLGYGAWWFEDARLFKDAHLFRKNLQLIDEELNRSKEVFIQDHKAKYRTPGRPPAWKTIGILSVGHLSKLYANLNSVPQKDGIARSLQVPTAYILESWLQSISLIRNLCAHHSRLWNKSLPKPPRLPARLPNSWISQLPVGPNKLYASLCCIKYLLNTIVPADDFTLRLNDLFSSYPSIDPLALGISPDWMQEILWNSKH